MAEQPIKDDNLYACLEKRMRGRESASRPQGQVEGARRATCNNKDHPVIPGAHSPGARIFLASFLVLFLEIALIRWMPAYIRLLAYFSNFILLASFLGIGVGCLLASSRKQLFTLFPLIQALVIAMVYFFRLEVALAPTGSLYFSSGTAEQVVAVESTLLLPVIFVVVAALFTTLAQRMGKEMGTLPPLRGYTLNLLGSLTGVGLFALISWLQLSPTWWFAIGFAAAIPLLLTSEPGTGQSAPKGVALTTNIILLLAALFCVHLLARGARWSPYYKITFRTSRWGRGDRGEQHLSPINGPGRPERILLPMALHGLWGHV